MNVLLVPLIQTVILILLADGYRFSIAIPTFWTKSKCLEFRMFRSTAFHSYCALLFLYSIGVKYTLFLLKSTLNAIFIVFFQSSAFSHLVSLDKL